MGGWKRTSLTLIVGAGVVMALGVGLNLSWSRSRPAPMVVEPGDLDFGEVWEQEVVARSLPITNAGSKGMQILGFKTSCGCTSVEPGLLTIEPGATEVATVTLDVMALRGDAASDGDVPFEVQLVPTLKDELPNRYAWRVHGTVRTAFSRRPPVIDLGEIAAEADRREAVAVEAVCRVGMKDLSVTCRSQLATVAWQSDAGRPGVARIAVTPRPALPFGPFEFPIYLAATTADGVALPVVPWPVKGLAVRAVEFSPKHVTLGAIPLGQEKEETVTLYSTSKGPFVVAEVGSDSADVTVSAGESLGETIRTLKVRLRASRVGQISAKVRCVVRHSGTGREESLEMAIPLSGLGVPREESERGSQDSAMVPPASGTMD